jgi:nucleoside-diphosphate-sugar epimerase
VARRKLARVTTSPWLVLGAGYTGGKLAERLVREGQRVIVTRRDAGAAAAAAGALAQVTASADVRGVVMDLARPETLVIPGGAIVVCLAPPGDDPAAEIGALVAAARTADRLVYVSSTGVYAPAGGAWVDEHWPLEPVTRSGHRRVIAERGLPADTVVLRVAGIHGPGRGLVERVRAGTYRIIGDDRAHVSRIHVADLVDAIIRAGATTFAGPINVADDDPGPIGEVADSVARALGLPPPPRVPADRVDPEVSGMLTADRRIANVRMKQQLGVVLRYPSWRTLLSELGAEGTTPRPA